MRGEENSMLKHAHRVLLVLTFIAISNNAYARNTLYVLDNIGPPGGKILLNEQRVVRPEDRASNQTRYLKISDYYNKILQIGALYYVLPPESRDSRFVTLRRACGIVPGHGLGDIEIEDRPLLWHSLSQNFLVDAKVEPGILRFFGIDFGFSGQLTLKASVSNARERVLNENDAQTIFKKLTNGPMCSGKWLPSVSRYPKYQLVGYMYGNVTFSKGNRVGFGAIFGGGNLQFEETRSGFLVFKKYGRDF